MVPLPFFLLRSTYVSFSSLMKWFGLTHPQDTMANEQDYVELGLPRADFCEAPEWVMDGGKLDDLDKSACNGRTN